MTEHVIIVKNNFEKMYEKMKIDFEKMKNELEKVLGENPCYVPCFHIR